VIWQLETLHKICIIGDMAVGKSSFIDKYVYDRFNAQYFSSVGVNFALKTLLKDNWTFRLQLWDIASQERHSGMTKDLYKKCEGVFVMCDDRISSTENLKVWKSDIDNKVKWEKLYPKDVNPFILLVNKSDSFDCKNGTINFDEICKDNGFNSWLPISCKTGEGMQEACDKMIVILKQLNRLKPKTVLTVSELSAQQEFNILLMEMFKITNRSTDDYIDKIVELKSIYGELYFSEKSDEFFNKIHEQNISIAVINSIHSVLTDRACEDKEKCLKIQSHILNYGRDYHAK
jgi:small GTP-binding protein